VASDFSKGLTISTLGVLVISPDSLLIRLIGAETMTLLFWRGLISGTIMLLIFATVMEKKPLAAIRSLGLPGAAMAVIFCIGNISFIYSVTHTSVANSLFITSTAPVFAALLSRLVLKEPISRRTVWTIVAAMCGVGVIALGSIDNATNHSEGDAAALITALALACNFTIARAHRHVSMVPATGIGYLISSVLSFLVAPTLVLPEGSLPWLLILCVIVVPIGFSCLTTGPRYLPAPDVSLIVLLEAIFGPLLVWLILSEYPGHLALVGGGIVLSAMVISNSLALRRVHRVDKSPGPVQ